MRDYTGVPFGQITDPLLRRSLGTIDFFLRDLSRGVRRIENGEVPSGSGAPIPTDESGLLDDYLFLPGRAGGQVVHGVDAAAVVTIDADVAGTSAEGSIGNPSLRLSAAGVGLADFRPYRFGGVDELVVTGPTGAGIAVNFLSADSTSAFRIASTTNRTFLQCGLRNSASNIINANMTIGAAGARVATSLATEIQRIQFANSGTVAADGTAVTANTTRIGINVRPDDFASSAAGSRSRSLHIADFTSAAATDPAPVILENVGNVAGRRMIEIRAASAGSTPTRTIGAISFAIADTDTTGASLLWFTSGTRRARIMGIMSGTGSGGLIFLNSNDRLSYETLPETGAFADSVTSHYFRIANTSTEVNRLMIASEGTAAFSRLGIIATSTILGPAPTGLMPAPVSSRILTLVNSAGTVLSGFTSAGAHFHVSGASNGFVWTSDANGVGSWQAGGGGGLDGTANEVITGSWSFEGTGGVTTVESVSLNASDGNYAPLAYVTASPSSGNPAYTFLTITESTLTNTLQFSTDSALSGNTNLLFPSVGGTVVTTSATQTLSNKTLNTANTLRTASSGLGVAFEDNTTTSKKLRMILSGAVGNNTFTFTNTAARNYGFGNLSGNVPIVGDDTPAVASGNLGKVDLTGQTAAIGSTNLSSTPPAGIYAVEVYAACTTASGSGAPTLDVTIAWTDVVGATTQNAVTGLTLAGTGRASGRVLVQVASGDIAYTTTINAASGSPQYAIYIRVVALG